MFFHNVKNEIVHQINNLGKCYNQYQLIIKLGLRATFSDNIEFAKKIESEMVDHFFRQEFDNKSLKELNEHINLQLQFLETNPISVMHFAMLAGLALLALTGIIFISVIMSSAKYDNLERIHTSAAIASAVVVSSIIFFNFGQNHTTLLTSAAKRQAESALKELMQINEITKEAIKRIYTELNPKEKEYLTNELTNLSKHHSIELLANNRPDITSSTILPETKWMFFNHAAYYAYSKKLDRIRETYHAALSELKKEFLVIKDAIQANKEDIIILSNENTEPVNFIIDLNPDLDFEGNLDKISDGLAKIQKSIDLPQNNMEEKKNITRHIKLFSDKYGNLVKVESELSKATVNMNITRLKM